MTALSSIESQAVDTCLARSVLYGALALGFHRPTEELLGRLTSPEGRRAMRGAARLLDAAPPGRAELTRAVDRLTDLEGLEAERLADLHQRLFGHTARSPVTPYETEYGIEGLFQQPQELADISGYYLAFGLRTQGDSRERPDHVGCECEFMDFLSRKEAVALAREDAEMARETRRAYRGFLRDHLGRFGRAFAARLEAVDDGFHGLLGDLLRALLRSESTRLNVPLGRELLELRSTEDTGVPMACGGGEDGSTEEEPCGTCLP